MAPSLPPDFCPYRGLEPYDESYRDFFFGREQDQQIIASNLYAAPLTVLYGASGVGKSSVLLAGVVPEVRRQRRVAVAVFRQWQDPRFAEALKVEIQRAVSTRLGREVAAEVALPFDEFLERCLEALRGPIFLILDQFEEYFLYEPTRGFDAELARAINRRDIDVNFLLSMREEGLSRLDRFQGRIPNLLNNLLRLDHLDRDAAVRAIRKPLDEYNRRIPPGTPPVTVEEELVQALIEEVRTDRVRLGQAGLGQATPAADPGAVARIETPYLQIVLTRLWRTEREATSAALRLATFRELGAARRIVRSHLEEVIGTLSEAEQDVARRAFIHLITPTGSKIAHTAADLASYAKVPVETLEPVLAKLAKPGVHILRRLAPACEGEGAPRFEIFHDKLAEAIVEWRQRLEREEARDKARIEAEELRRREREDLDRRLARERARRLTYVVAALGVVALLMAGLVLLAWTQRTRALREQRQAQSARALAEEKAAEARRAQEDADLQRRTAEQQSRVAESRELALNATLQLAADPELSAVLALEAVTRAPTEEAADVLRQALEQLRLLAVLGEAADEDSAAVFSPDGSRVAVLATNRVVEIWRRPENQRAARLVGHEDRIATIAFSPDGHRLVTASRDTTARVWDVATGRQVHRLEWPHVAPDADARTHHYATSAQFSPDGRSVLTTGHDGVVMLWDAATGTNRLSLPRHPAAVLSGSFSGEGTRILTVSVDRAVRVFDAQTGKRVAELAHPWRVNTAAFSPDGRWVIAAGADAWVWRLPEATHLALGGHKGEVNWAGFSPDGHRMVTASSDDTALIWLAPDQIPILAENLSWIAAQKVVQQNAAPGLEDVAASQLLAELRGHTDDVVSATFSPDGTYVATTSRDTTARVWETATGRSVAILRGHPAEVTSADFDPRAAVVLTSSRNNPPRLWAWQTGIGESLQVLSGHTGPLNAAEFSPNGGLIATAGQDATARLWDPTTGQARHTLTNHTGPVTSLSFSRDSRYLLTASNDRTARVWDTANGRELAVLREHLGPVVIARFAPDATAVVTVDREVMGQRGAQRHPTRAPADAVRTVGWRRPGWEGTLRPTGRRGGQFELAEAPSKVRSSSSGYEETTLSTVRWWDWRQPAVTNLVRWPRPVTVLEFNPTGERLVAADSSGRGSVYETGTGQSRAFRAFPVAITCAAFSPDDVWLALGGQSGKVLLEGQGTHGEKRIEGPEREVRALGFAPRGDRLVAGFSDSTARVWDLRRIESEPLSFTRHTGPVNTATFDASGRFVVTAGDETARVWEAETGRELAVLRGHAGAVKSARFDPSGARVLTAGADGTARLFTYAAYGSLDALVATARERVSRRSLTAEERAKFLHTSTSPGTENSVRPR